jgi:hypothetical protein
LSYVAGVLTVPREKTAVDDQTDDFVVTAGPAISTAPVQLKARLTQQADGNDGDITLAKVTFVLTPTSGPVITVPNIAVSASGDASTVYNVPVGSYTVSEVISSGNLYWTQDPAGASTLEVTPGSNDQRVTGGGWIADAASRNGKDNFGFTVYYNKTGAPKGNFLFMFRGKDGYDYQLKNNSWAKGGLSFTQNGQGAFFTGKGTLTKIDQLTGLVVGSDGSYTFEVNLKDGNLATPKVADILGITIKDGSSNVWKSIAPVTLGGGNVTVQSK